MAETASSTEGTRVDKGAAIQLLPEARKRPDIPAGAWRWLG